MKKTFALRLLRIIPVAFLVSLAAFFMLELVPGDPVAAVLGESATPEQYEAARVELGLDRPAHERYFEWLGGAVRLDFGTSLVPPVRDVSETIIARLPVTAEIAVLAMLMSLAFSIPMGMWTAYRAGSAADTIAGGSAFAAISVPSFLSALLLIFLLVFHTDVAKAIFGGAAALGAASLAARAVVAWRRDGSRQDVLRLLAGAAVVAGIAVLLFTAFPSFPRQGFERLTGDKGILANLRSAFLPALTLALVEGAVFMRVLRNDMVTTLQEDYVLAARAKGMPPWRILLRDALRPSSFSLVTVGGVALGRLLGGTVIVETIFRLPGMGSLLVESIQQRDYPVVQAGVLVLAVIYVVVNTAVDLSYAYLDPRIRRGRR